MTAYSSFFFVNGDVVSAAVEKPGGGQTCDTSTDDDNRLRPIANGTDASAP